MRTTLSLDDDVAAMIERIREERKLPLKVVVNLALREGLVKMSELAPPRKKIKLKTWNSGGSLVGSLDNIAEVLAIAEGEDYK